MVVEEGEEGREKGWLRLCFLNGDLLKREQGGNGRQLVLYLTIF